MTAELAGQGSVSDLFGARYNTSCAHSRLCRPKIAKAAGVTQTEAKIRMPTTKSSSDCKNMPTVNACIAKMLTPQTAPCQLLRRFTMLLLATRITVKAPSRYASNVIPSNAGLATATAANKSGNKARMFAYVNQHKLSSW
jgi:hypothetical protein